VRACALESFYLGGVVVVVVLGVVVVVVLGAVGTASVVVPPVPPSEVPAGNSVVVFDVVVVGSFVWATVKGPFVCAYAGMAMTSPAATAK
jgi:hypothetical protein